MNALAVDQPTDYFRLTERRQIVNYLRSWDRLLKETGTSHLLCYTYLQDEPNDQATYESVRKWGTAIREAGPGVKVLVTEQTTTQNAAWGDLYGAVDIWVPLFPLFNPESAGRRQAAGEEIWTYTALSQSNPPTPWWQIDRPLVNYRAPCVIAWRYGIKGLLYWGEMSHWKGVSDPWVEPATHGAYNGEGNFLYPGADVGFDGPLPSLRLKVLRSGLQDYDYLHILEKRGLREEAMEEVRRVGSSWSEWSRDPQVYLSARRALANLILKGKCRVVAPR